MYNMDVLLKVPGSRIVKTIIHGWFVCYTTNTKGKECSSILSSRLWQGALRGDTKNGCVADYPSISLVLPLST